MTVDVEKFRLRTLVERMVQQGECLVHDAPIDLCDVAEVLDTTEEAVWFTAVGPERAELVGNVMGSRSRLAMSLEATPLTFPKVLRDRLAKPIAPIEVTRQQAPVQQVVLTGADADLTSLPVNLQHQLDGAPYISSSIDYAVDPDSGWTNLGCRRMMLTGMTTAGIDINAPSDLRAIYQKAMAKGENMPVAFTVGSHTSDFLAAVAVTVPMNEFDVIGAIRGQAVPIVKCVTQDVWVPADAEMVLEGYLDPRGLVEPEGPYGEFIGYYGSVKRNPLFHLTAITKRHDALFQTVTIGGKNLGRTDTSNLGSAKTEAAIWDVLRLAVREPVAVHATASSGGMYNVRVSIKQRYPGEARNAIAAVFCSIGDVKHVFVVDEDIDVNSNEQIDWALATRFQADKDIVAASGFRAVPLDPSLAGSRTGAKAGFDCTIPFAQRGSFEFTIPTTPVLGAAPAEPQTLESLLSKGPLRFVELMTGLGSRDGREIVRQFDGLMAAGKLKRTTDGRYEMINGAA
ncbi:UbiD family decarboxylase [Caulobacter sp. S45]|uniref:UbiD family decarboxylase n=1 Tax=Caulobacter sp. S45 TaxID=1641861 RepID=UPI00131E1E27|nr:UbiD family decarboxylase [Caulobacter sp. S45]